MAAEESSKVPALVGSGRSIGAFPYVLSSLERENRALKRENEKYKKLNEELREQSKDVVVEVNDTLNRAGNRLMVQAEYGGDRQWFPIPDNVDLQDETQVSSWYVDENQLFIEYVDDRDDDIIDYLRDDPDQQVVKTTLTENYFHDFYPQDEQDEDE